MINQYLESCALIHKVSCAADHIPSLWALSLLSDAPCLFIVGLTRNNLILASLSLGHGAAWNRGEQTLDFGICCDEWLPSASSHRPRAQALCRHSCRRDRHTLGFREQCQTTNSHGRRKGPPPFTCNCTCCWSFIFALTIVALRRGFPSIQNRVLDWV